MSTAPYIGLPSATFALALDSGSWLGSGFQEPNSKRKPQPPNISVLNSRHTNCRAHPIPTQQTSFSGIILPHPLAFSLLNLFKLICLNPLKSPPFSPGYTHSADENPHYLRIHSSRPAANQGPHACLGVTSPGARVSGVDPPVQKLGQNTNNKFTTLFRSRALLRPPLTLQYLAQNLRESSLGTSSNLDDQDGMQ